MDMNNPDFVPVAESNQLRGDGAVVVQVDGKPVLVVRAGTKLYALSGVCTHEATCFTAEDVLGEEILCPTHFASFDVRTGEVTAPPAETPLAMYDVTEADGWISVSKAPRT